MPMRRWGGIDSRWNVKQQPHLFVGLLSRGEVRLQPREKVVGSVGSHGNTSLAKAGWVISARENCGVQRNYADARNRRVRHIVNAQCLPLFLEPAVCLSAVAGEFSGVSQKSSMGLDAVVPTLLIVITGRDQYLCVSEPLAEFQCQKIQGLNHKSAIVFPIVVVSDRRIDHREVVGQ